MQLPKLPESAGVYLFQDKKGKVLYVGKSINVKQRVASYFNKSIIGDKTAALVSATANIDYTQVTSELEALLLEAYLIKKYQPFFNARSKDDKHPLYIKITLGDKYPRVFSVRREDNIKARYFGPFPSSQTVKEILKLLRGIFPYDMQKTIGKRACFWSHIGLCNPCPSVIERLTSRQKKQQQAKYNQNIKNLLAVLSRKTGKVRNDLTSKMLVASKKLNYEEAAKIRDQLSKLDYITKEYRSVSSFLDNPNLISDIRLRELEELRLLLSAYYKLPTTIRRIECFDASHTGMVNPTVGMVTFVNGEPDKNLYRRFRIRGKVVDDLSFLEEALRRRFSHHEWGIPDLLIIDGGKTQVGRARGVMRELNLRIPAVGIVKPFDDLVIPYQDGFLIKKTQGPGRSLVQRLRDEAHRFAKTYHIKLRSKRVLYK